MLLLPLLAACHEAATADAQTGRSGDPLLDRGPVDSRVTLDTARLPGLGTVLTDGRDRVLYMFPPDAQASVRCTGPCAGTWPTLTVSDSGRVEARGAVRPNLIGYLPDPTSGARVVTYRGNPLYLYAGDVEPLQSNGQGLFLDGGPWYVLTATGQPVTSERDPEVER